jgi:hypothetical protein
MTPDWRENLKAWKGKFPWYMRIVYTLIGYPPMHPPVTDQEWKSWDNRFNAPEYDWRHHTGVDGPVNHNPPVKKS